MKNNKCAHCGKFYSYKDLDSYTPFGCSEYEDPEPLPPIIICRRCSKKLKKKFIEQFNQGDYSGDYKKSRAEIQAANECNLKWIDGYSSIIYKGKRIYHQYIPKQYLHSENSIKDPTILQEIPNKVFENILKIVSRIKKYSSTWNSILQLELSLSLALHYQKGYFDTALDHKRLLSCDKFDLFHDVYGVYNNIDTVSGKLKNHFVPRITLPIEDYNKFDSLEDYQKYLQEGNSTKDIVTISGVIFTMDFYDIDGNEITYRNKKEKNAFRITTKNRYKHGYKNAKLEYFTPICFRNDINYTKKKPKGEYVICPVCNHRFDSAETFRWMPDKDGHPTIESLSCPKCKVGTEQYFKCELCAGYHDKKLCGMPDSVECGACYSVSFDDFKVDEE